MSKESEISNVCPVCEGRGWFVDEFGDWEAACCGQGDKYGNCCNNSIVVPKAIQKCCSYCGGSGKVPKNHLEIVD